MQRSRVLISHCKRRKCIWVFRLLLKIRRNWRRFVKSAFIGSDIVINCQLYREADITRRRIDKILATGANVVLTTGGIDDMCLKQFVEAGAMGVRRCKKQDLKRIAKATGGTHRMRFYFIYF
jgi:chaperonin GroEL (HSP60 family)